ncbi:TetR family transcriptional regulator [Pendulispora rubella]|uniref:TetR family transcriptional regulator n=1 Tax=Pendulispora rubella TaxID=2741070 RepID=A0ABZ2L747_9BACT
MRKSRQEAAETRERIVENASTEFRRNGIGATGLSDIMGAAGLTHGGFYKHFASKDEVVEESLRRAVDGLVEGIEGTIATAKAERGLSTAISNYLSLAHRDNTARGCPFAALGSELARSSDSVREAATVGFQKLVDTLAKELQGGPATAKKEALAIVCAMIGAQTMARMVTDPALSETILRQVRKQLPP